MWLLKGLFSFLVVSLVVNINISFAMDDNLESQKPEESYQRTNKNIVIGIGFLGRALSVGNYPDEDGMSGISSRIWFRNSLGLQLVYNRKKYENEDFDYKNKEFLMGGRVLYKIKNENNLDSYIGIGISRQKEKREYVFYPSSVSTERITGREYELFGGIEYYFKELPRLGFSVEIGYSRINLKQEDTPSNEKEKDNIKSENLLYGEMGIHYYF
ncbi:MAG: hypothetical protein AB1414_06195 [bacterium]